MRKVWCAGALAAAIALVAAAQAPPRCTGTPSKKPYCKTCDKTLDPKTEMKGKKCAKDDTETTLVDVCVKKTPYVKCHPNKEGLKIGGT
ncbi:MAG: hypothetical protein ACK44W_05025, partial [Planctomycetota bacterium]